MKPLLTKEKIEEIRDNPDFARLFADMRAYAEAAVGKEEPALPYSLFSLFEKTGDRALFEERYFERRRRFCAFAILYLVDRDEKWKRALEDCIFEICCEATWALPAHIGGYPAEEYGVCIDLFSSETGEMIAELLNMVRDELSPRVVLTAEREIRRRIITPFLQYGAKHYWWHKADNNWAAVCACGVGSCFLHLGTKEEIDRFLEELPPILESFLHSFDPDGCCLEGYSYWVYGFGRYVYLADLLLDYSGGKVDIMKQYEKVRRIADFPNHVFVGDTEVLTFSDGVRGAYAVRGISAYIHKVFPEIPMPAKALYDPSGFGREFVATVRDLAWFDGRKVPEKRTHEPLFVYKHAQWYIRHTDAFCLVAKGGCNAEPHNHNDVGNFLLLKGNTRLFDDFGAGRYTRQYFAPGERYTIFVNSSRGHSVPIINGHLQNIGVDHAAELLYYDENVCAFELSKVYDDPTLTGLVRRFDVLPDGIRLTDTFDFEKAPEALTERFITRIQSEKCCGGVRVENGTFTADFACDVILSVENVLPHSVLNGDPNATVPVYVVDFVPKKTAKHIALSFTAKIEE